MCRGLSCSLLITPLVALLVDGGDHGTRGQPETDERGYPQGASERYPGVSRKKVWLLRLERVFRSTTLTHRQW